MTRISDEEELPEFPGCRFRVWTTLELEVGSAKIVLEGQHAVLLLELLRNRNEYVPALTLWTAVFVEGPRHQDLSIWQTVSNEISLISYALSARGIIITIDASDPAKGFRLAELRQADIPQRPTLMLTRKRKARAGTSEKSPQAPASAESKSSQSHGDNDNDNAAPFPVRRHSSPRHDPETPR
jgi:hypothetical protein